MNTCLICNKTFASALALAGHKRLHGPSRGKISQVLCSCIFTKIEIPVSYLAKFQKNLKPCKECTQLFKPKSSRLYFCSQSCSASYNNKKRGPRSEGTKQKISQSLTHSNKRKKSKKIHKEIVGPFSKVFLCTCKHCKTKSVSRTKKQYCVNHRDLYSSSNKLGYKFTFNVFLYPDLFDIELLNRIGWFSPGGKSGKWNPEGLSRDHKVSVNDAILNNYDPYYITHPLNCELMPHKQNNTKKTKSSITYEELKRLVDDYDSLVK